MTGFFKTPKDRYLLLQVLEEDQVDSCFSLKCEHLGQGGDEVVQGQAKVFRNSVSSHTHQGQGGDEVVQGQAEVFRSSVSSHTPCRG